MNNEFGAKSLRKVVIAGIAALSLAGVAQSIEPAQALSIASPIASQSGSMTTPTVEPIAYYGYYHRYYPRYHRRFYGRYYRYGRYYGYGRRGQCRGGLGTHLSKRYC